MQLGFGIYIDIYTFFIVYDLLVNAMCIHFASKFYDHLLFKLFLLIFHGGLYFIISNNGSRFVPNTFGQNINFKKMLKFGAKHPMWILPNKKHA